MEAARITTSREADRMREADRIGVAQVSFINEEEQETIKRRVKQILKKGASSELLLTFTFGALCDKIAH